MRELTTVIWNFDRNGAGDRGKRRRGFDLQASLNPHLVLRQEMWGSEADGSTVLYEQEEVLGLRGWLGQRASTAVFADSKVFRPVREFVQSAPVWVQPPTALAFRFTPAGSSSLPLVAVSYHLNYASASNRMSEVEWLTNFADKKWRMPNGEMVTLPALLGGDNNSYPAPGVEGDVPLPELDKIADRPHRLHRSHVGTAGRRRMDTRPDEALRLAGLEDIARHWATTRDGNRATALSRTVNACATHGPNARIDRAYATPTLLPAVTGVDVIEVDEQMSDHHIVRIKLDRDALADILNNQTDTAAA